MAQAEKEKEDKLKAEEEKKRRDEEAAAKVETERLLREKSEKEERERKAKEAEEVAKRAAAAAAAAEAMRMKRCQEWFKMLQFKSMKRQNLKVLEDLRKVVKDFKPILLRKRSVQSILSGEDVIEN